MERIFASTEAIDLDVDRIIACRARYPQPLTERILPDGAIHLIFNLGDRLSGDRGAELPCLAMGATCSPARVMFRGVIEQVCVTLRVGAAASILGVPARELTDRGVALEDLWGPAARSLLDELSSLEDARARVERVSQVLGERFHRASRVSPSGVVRAAISRIARASGLLIVRELASELGLSERRLQQLFHEQIGLSPKEMCRLARFRAAIFSRRCDPERPWIDIAHERGFYDQAHLTHELKTFTGLTPGELADFGFFQDEASAA